MSDVNTVILTGRLGQEPKIIVGENGSKMARLSIASSEQFTDRAGEKQERTTWTNVALYNKTDAEFAERNLHKGSKVLIQGTLETRTWEKDGENRTSTEVALRPYHSLLQILDVRAKAQPEASAKESIGSRPGYANGSQPAV
jgi:single-strand DNA-binding protein